MKVILSVPDEGYSRILSVPDEGYSRNPNIGKPK
jgi:hypothetical protein